MHPKAIGRSTGEGPRGVKMPILRWFCAKPGRLRRATVSQLLRLIRLCCFP